MRFVSTRGGAPPVSFTTAVVLGLAPDGGLYVPSAFPMLGREDLDDLLVRCSTERRGLVATATRTLGPFLAGDELEAALPAIVDEAFSFPLPLVHLEDFSVLELFHGPTAAFKDVGARFMAACFGRVVGRSDRGGDDSAPATPRTILVATSGDTGGAVASAFHGRPGFRVVVLFPSGRVSARQQHQLTCFGGNVRSFAVRGTFDDCQRLLKAALGDPVLADRYALTTANSINVARLLPQVVYHALAALRYRRQRGVSPTLVVPSGNVGNALAAMWARRMGLPIERVVMATNANRVVGDFFATGRWEPRPSEATLANAMDVGDPSNMERAFHLYPDHDQLRRDVVAVAVDDDTIASVIRDHAIERGRVWDPHTATAVHAVNELDLEHAVVVSTAHPAKFDEIVEPLVGRSVEVPPALRALLDRPASHEELEPDVESLEEALARA